MILDATTVTHFMIPFSRNEQYIGGSQKLASIKDKLTGDGHRRLALWGMGGVGYVEYEIETCSYRC